MMFGSDWPVCLLAGSYGQTVPVVRQLLAPVLNEDAERKIFGENVARFYRLPMQSQ